MSKIKDVAKKLNPFAEPETPDLPELPEPALMEDTDAIEKARRRKVAAATQRSGAASTVLSQTGNRTVLGGG
ncbi:MAG TPA: hypothetical protein PKI99_04155 [Terrimesophilobacter sp.]|nr:hypothetical protein [Terrimesophilobacter sp.]